LATDADVVDQRLDAIARTVCDKDPRTHEQRRAAALGALGHHAERLVCECENPDCDAAQKQPSAVVVHVIAREESLTDDTPAQLDGKSPPLFDKPLSELTWGEATAPTPRPTNGPAATPPAALLSGTMMPAPLLAAKVASTAKLVPIIHSGEAPPEPRYIPSAILATFIRCRDMTCRFPGCDEPAFDCDIDHTIAYPAGPTQASNLKCLCRQHHLLKTFWGWRDEQHPDGSVLWTCPQGQTYTTHPGSRTLFPTLCRPTAPITVPGTAEATNNYSARTLAMPRRETTRAHNRTQAINDERRHNEAALRADAEERTRHQRQNPGNNWEQPYLAAWPRPPSYDDDPPPF
jgi:hypothetical protein